MEDSLHDGPKRRRRQGLCPQDVNDKTTTATTSTKSSSSSPYTPRFKINEAFMSELDDFVKERKSWPLKQEEMIDILMYQTYLRYEHELMIKKAGTDQTVPDPRINETVCKAFRLNDEQIVERIWYDYVHEKKISVPPPSMSTTSSLKLSTIPDTRMITSKVQAFMRDRHEIRGQTHSKDILEYLVKENLMPEDADIKAVERFLLRKGYITKRKKKSKTNENYMLKYDHIVKRNKYTARMMHENAKKTRRIVYLDESYICKNYCRDDNSLYDANDEQDLYLMIRNPAHREQQYCFIAAIIDADLTVPEEQRTDEQKAGLIIESLDIFEGGTERTKDYRDKFDHKYFVDWMKKLLDTLERRNIKNAVIVMDNAKHHKSLPESTPKGHWKRERLLEKCKELNLEIPYSDFALKGSIWHVLCAYIKKNVHPVVSDMAKEAGHEVIYSPPNYSELQPIETVWATVKCDVGRQYTPETTFKQVLERLTAAFDNLQSQTVQDCIDKANERLRCLYKQILRLEEYESIGDRAEDDGDNEEMDFDDFAVE